MANKIALSPTKQNMEAFIYNEIIFIKHKVTVLDFSDLFYAIHFFSTTFRWFILICLEINGSGTSWGSDVITVTFCVQGPASEVIYVDDSIIRIILGSLS